MKILFAVKKGDEDWQEQLITEVEEQIEAAKTWAVGQGFDRFRVAEISDDPPDFASTVNVGRRKRRTK